MAERLLIKSKCQQLRDVPPEREKEKKEEEYRIVKNGLVRSNIKFIPPLFEELYETRFASI